MHWSTESGAKRGHVRMSTEGTESTPARSTLHPVKHAHKGSVCRYAFLPSPSSEADTGQAVRDFMKEQMNKRIKGCVRFMQDCHFYGFVAEYSGSQYEEEQSKELIAHCSATV